MQIILRPVSVKDAPLLARILIRSNEVFRGLVPDSCLDFPEEESTQNWYELLNQGLDEHEFILIAVDEGDEKVVGYCWGCPTNNDSDYAGELKQISVLPEYQRQGIGRLMVKTVAQKLMEQSIHSMCVHVLEINPNRSFYERLGAKYIKQYPFNWDNFETISYIYAWDDISVLI